jgi:hypothetical protein
MGSEPPLAQLIRFPVERRASAAASAADDDRPLAAVIDLSERRAALDGQDGPVLDPAA